MKKIAILGASGYIGSYLSQKLKYKFKIITHSRKKIFNRTFNYKIYKTINGDIKKLRTLKNIIKLKPDIIVYTISLNHIASEKNLNNSLKNNYTPLVNLISEIKKKKLKTKIIYLSTVQVYGREFNRKIISENFEKRIENIYSLTHSMCEDLLYFNNKIIKFHCLRISNTFGMPILPKIDCWWLVLNNFCKDAINKNKIIINSDGSALRDFISLDLVYETIVRLVGKDRNIPFINVCSGNTISIRELAHKISKNNYFKNKIKIEIKKKKFIPKKKFKYDTSILKKLSVNTNENINERITTFLKCLNKT